MKIAHIASAYDIVNEKSAGRSQLVYLLAEKQQSEGHKVTVIAAPGSHVEGCKIVSFAKPKNLPRDRFRFWLLRRKAEIQHYYNSFKWLGKCYDIIHSHIVEEGLSLSSLASSPCISTHHGYAPQGFLQYLFMKLNASVPHKSKLVAISKYIYSAHKRLYGDDVIGYVYDCLDTTKFHAVYKPDKSHDIELVFLGRCVPWKGVDIAVKVADKLHEMGHDVHLRAFTSPYPGYLRYLTTIIQLVKKRPYISMGIGKPWTEIMPFLSNSDALLFPALGNEPFPYVMIESMACGTPVLAFPGGSVPEIVQSGVNGFQCNAFEDMVAAVLDVHKINRKTCRQIVEKNFGVDKTYQDYLRIYEKTING